MSQTTCCPSCGTLFKVVADQLRISDGWVRCGQCKQVFDAASQLQAAEKPPLLPDFQLDQWRAPPAPVRRPEPEQRLWGQSPSSAVKEPLAEHPLRTVQPGSASQPAPSPAPTFAPASASTPASTPVPAATKPEPPSEAVATPAPALAPDSAPAPVVKGAEPPASPRPVLPALAPVAVVAEPAFPVLHVPEPVVPAFLATEPVSEPTAAPPEPAALDKTVPEPTAPPRNPVHAVERSAAESAIEWPSLEIPSAAAVASEPAGYELPTPQIEAEEELEPSPHCVASTPNPLTAAAPESAAPDAGVEPAALEALQLVPKDAWATKQGAQPPKAAGASPAPLQEAQTQAAQTQPAKDPTAEPAEDEPSFIRAARRKAFWRRPGVRAGLFLLALGLLFVLGVQVALQERSFLAARLPALRPALSALCDQMACTVEPYRHIASVEVDSSTFQKTRGDEYRLALVLKNRSELAVAMPAVELTLTDAMDQPVLRRVILPQQWAAPAELGAHGEWSVARSVVISSMQARITGYRVVAFYP